MYGEIQYLKELRKSKGLTLIELAKKVGVSAGTISRWESGEIANMRRDKIALLAKALEVKPTELLNLPDTSPTEGYYTDPEVAEMANKLKNNPDMRILFDAAEDMSKDDIEFVVDMIDKLKKREGK